MGGLLIGLTGTFGSGKSTVAAILGELGAAIVDADVLARQAVEPGRPALEEIRRVFGEEFIARDGTLDRKRMAAVVFGSRKKRERLERIIHPRVREQIDKSVGELEAARARTGNPAVIVLNVPLLFESGLTWRVDKILVVTICEAERFHRVRARDGLSEAEVVRRLSAQWPQREKAKRADCVVDNSGAPPSTRKQVGELFSRWLKERNS